MNAEKVVPGFDVAENFDAHLVPMEISRAHGGEDYDYEPVRNICD